MTDSSGKFKTAQGAVMTMTPHERAQFDAWYKSSAPSDDTAASRRLVSERTRRLYKDIEEALRSRSVEVTSLNVLSKLKPSLVKVIDQHADQFERSLVRLFSGCRIEEVQAVRVFLVRSAASRLEEQHSAVTVNSLLNALVPLEEMVDDMFPGYRAAGVLKSALLQQMRQGKRS